MNTRDDSTQDCPTDSASILIEINSQTSGTIGVLTSLTASCGNSVCWFNYKARCTSSGRTCYEHKG